MNLNGCSKLVSIEKVFSGCTSLESVDLSGCIKIRVLDAFSGCTSLKSVDLTGCDELRLIGGFSNCVSLEAIDLSSSYMLRKIGERAFYGCTNVAVKLPANITEIERGAFGENYGNCCQKVLVPNQTIRQLVISSKYPVDRIEMY